MLDLSTEYLSKINADEWPTILLQKLPALLNRLLDKGVGASLERLQLIKIEISHLDSRGPFENSFYDITLNHTISSAHKFIELAGTLALNEERRLKVIVTYAMRGEKKYWRPKPFIKAPDFHPIEAISALDVKLFLKKINQNNSFFYDQELSQLNGFPHLFVPASLVIHMLIKFSQKLMKNEPRFFSFTFFEALPILEDLAISITEHDEGLSLLLKAGPNQAVQLCSFASKLMAEPALNQSICTGDIV